MSMKGWLKSRNLVVILSATIVHASVLNTARELLHVEGTGIIVVVAGRDHRPRPGGRRHAGADPLRLSIRGHEFAREPGPESRHPGKGGRCGCRAPLSSGACALPLRLVGAGPARRRRGGLVLGLRRRAEAGPGTRCQIGGGSRAAVGVLRRARETPAPGGGAAPLESRGASERGIQAR